MDQYYIVKILGRGSEGQVLLAEHKKTREEIAIKRVEWASFEDANHHLNEAHRLKQLNHKNILKYHKVFLTKYSAETQFVCICVEYCPGGDLSNVIQRSWSNKKHMNEDDILRYLLEISEGLSYLHEQGIIHRDLKPQNILLAQDGVLKIGDFGISREMGSSILKTQCGTPSYMSWEMLNKEAYNEMTDMYSLGVILIQMLTGKVMMMSIELGKNPDLFIDLEKELVRRYGYSLELIRLAERLVGYSQSERPSAAETVSIVRRIMLKKRRLTLTPVDVLPHAMKLEDSVKLKIFTFLEISDMYQVMQACKHFFSLWDKFWWEMYCLYTVEGEKIMKTTAEARSSFRISSSISGSSSGSNSSRRFSDVTDNGNPINRVSSSVGSGTFNWKRSSDVGESSPITHRGRSNSAKSRLVEVSDFSIPRTSSSEFTNSHHSPSRTSTINNDTTGRHSYHLQSSSIAGISKSFKEQVFAYFKIHKPQKERARKNIGKRIAAEIHPSQIPAAAEFLAKSFLKYNNDWLKYAFGLPRDIDEELDLSPPDVPTVEVTPDPSDPSRVYHGYKEDEKEEEEEESPDARLEQMKWFFSCVIKYGIKFGRVWVNTFYRQQGDQEIQGISIWQHPYNGTKMNIWKLLRVGIARAPKYKSVKLMYRILKAIDYAEKVHTRLLDQKTKPHWTLFLIAVKPSVTNNGIGASIMLPVMRSADEQSIPIYSTVYSPSLALIKFFKRHGFDISEKVEQPKIGPPFYAMIRYLC